MKEIYEKCFATRLTNSLDGKDHPLMYSWKPSFSKIKGHGEPGGVIGGTLLANIVVSCCRVMTCLTHNAE